MRFIKLLVALTLIGLISSINISYAGSLDDARKLNSLTETFTQRLRNIDPMIKAMPRGFEKDMAFSIFTDFLEIQNDLSNLFELKILINNMESVKDKAAVKALIDEHVRLILKYNCTSKISLINMELLQINNPALLSEVQHARDDVVQACDIVQHWK